MKIASEIAALVPYKPGKPISETQREFGLRDVVKLASNENPLGPSPRVIAALSEALGDLHRYPDAAAFEALEALARYYGVQTSWLALGNGSNEIIDLLIRIYLQPGDRVFTSQAAFIAYKICAQAARVGTLEVPLTSDLRFDLAGLHRALSQAGSGNKLVFIANPNNPTGTYVNRPELKAFLDATSALENTLVILDEAYCEFVRAPDYPDGLELLKSYPHVACLRTLSKVFGIAGLRVGALIARPEVIDLFNRVRNPFNVNSLAQIAAAAAVQDSEFIARARQINGEGLDYLVSELGRLGLKCVPSQANFILVDFGRDALPIYEGLLRQGVIVRPVNNYGMPHHLRLSVGLPSENQKLVAALKNVLEPR